MIRAILVLNFLLIIALAVYVLLKPSTEGKTVYVLNSAVFAGFKGKQTLESKLKKMKEDNKKVLDSLSGVVERNNKPEILQHYRNTEDNFRILEQQLSEQYTADIWKRINAYLVAFGKEKHYAFIFGASGNGNVMYADDAVNVTEEAIEFINNKYEAEE